LLNRQKVLLYALRESGGSATKLQLVKWAFLVANETSSNGGSAFYQFVPYKYGPYSFTLNQEMAALIRDGLITEKNDSWELTPVGQSYEIVLSKNVKLDISSTLKLYGEIATEKLLDILYRRYPWFTLNSVKAEKRTVVRPVVSPAIYTIGYEGLLIDGFLNKLLKNGIECLIDVRSNPVSRRYGFHKSTLMKLCSLLSIQYVHVPELGISSSDRENVHSPSEFNRLFDYYKTEILKEQVDKIKEVSQIALSKPSALLCMEADPLCCHRSHLANALSPVSSLGIEHLEWPR
jgi:uncharacterized protein (DUF488 family)